MHAHVVGKMDDITPASVRKWLFLCREVTPKKLIFKLSIDNIECTCAGVEAQQYSISSVFSLHHISLIFSHYYIRM